MDNYQFLAGLTTLVVLLALFALLFLQVAMLLRFRHISFLLLSLGSALGVGYSLLYIVPFFLQISDSQRLVLFQCQSVAAAVAAIVIVCGTASLFRTYRGLFQATHQAPLGSA